MLPWDLMPGWEGYKQVPELVHEDRTADRYFSDNIVEEEGEHGLSRADEEAYVAATERDGHNIELWLSWMWAVLSRNVPQERKGDFSSTSARKYPCDQCRSNLSFKQG